MREIKFRIPLTSFATCEFVGFRYWSGGHGCFSLPQGIESNDSVWGDDEQFTGLKDKNGREIYEGDIVKVCEVSGKDIPPHHPWFHCGAITWQGVGSIGWAVCGKPHNHGLFESSVYLVIGNIHENQDLISK